MAQRAEAKGIEMACLIYHDLPTELRGDPGRLRQVLVNLVGNAIKFTDSGEILIRVTLERMVENQIVLRFSVTDTGIGIPDNRKGAIFDRFVQVESSTSRKYGGTGLGLTISKQLVELMGGEIGLESEFGKGSSFWFTVTFEKSTTLQQPLSQSIDLQNMHILGVDDHERNRVILTKMLENLGCRANMVDSGSEAIASLHTMADSSDPYRLVLLDMKMPELDGEQTLKLIRNDEKIKDIPIIIFTSMGQRGDAARLEALGCSGYLLKPVMQSQLREAILSVLSHPNVKPVKRRTGELITRHRLTEQHHQPAHILLAEDNPTNQKLVVALLQREGYSVDVAGSGNLAIEALQRKKYDLVMMDVQMPEMDGFEATQRIRDLEGEATHIPIIAMTAHAMKGDRERCMLAGMDDYLSKPIEPDNMFAIIQRWISKEDAAMSTVGTEATVASSLTV
jgi:two-component system sensor histidine kinase/response regulator